MASPIVVPENYVPRNSIYKTETNLFLNQRPTFKVWIKSIWLDFITLAITGGISHGIFMLFPLPERHFPIMFRSGEIVYPEIAYPLRPNIIPIWLATLLSFGVPALLILLCQIRIRSFWDVNNAILGLIYSLINASAFQVFIKWLIGGLRPYFLAVCKPDLSKIGEGVGFQNIMYTKAVCTGKESEIKEALESMPSGHSAAAFAGFVFLFLYLNAKLKLWSNYHPAYWKMILVYAPLLSACLISASLTIDAFHHWYDCVAGACIGIISAFGAYRMTYAAIWDWRYNHIPLPRDGFNELKVIPGYGSFGGFENAVATRKAGWGILMENNDHQISRFHDRHVVAATITTTELPV